MSTKCKAIEEMLWILRHLRELYRDRDLLTGDDLLSEEYLDLLAEIKVVEVEFARLSHEFARI